MTVVVPGMDLNCERVECQPTGGTYFYESKFQRTLKSKFFLIRYLLRTLDGQICHDYCFLSNVAMIF